MGWLEFVSSLVSSLAWPAVGALTVVLLRSKLAELVGRVTEWDGLGVRARFKEGLADASAAAVEAAEQAKSNAAGSSAETGADRSTARHPTSTQDVADEPAFVIVTAWEQVRSAVLELSEMTGVTAAGGRAAQPYALASALREAAIVNDAFVRSIRELASLRNLVAHGQHRPNRADADEYSNTAREIVAACDVLSRLYGNKRKTAESS